MNNAAMRFLWTRILVHSSDLKTREKWQRNRERERDRKREKERERERNGEKRKKRCE